MRKSWVEVDLEAISANTAALSRLVAPTKVCAVVKADGYGHGDVPVAEAALSGGAEWLAVALLEEGIRLREAGIEAPILVLSEPDLRDCAEFLHWRLTPTVYTEETIAEFGQVAEHQVDLHLKVDTGMHRVGAAPDRVPALMARINDLRLLRLGGVFTHFAVSEQDDSFTDEQIELFDRTTAPYSPPMTHLANTAGAVLHPSARRDLVRTGIGLYGLHPSNLTRPLIEIRPAMRIVSHVAHIQRLTAGERPSYGRRRELPRDSIVATVPIGYADGLPRLLSEEGEVLIGGKRRPLAGTVTMDQVVIDCGEDEVKVGEEVVLVGRQGLNEITADDWASWSQTISYEIVCQVGPRLPRRYLS